MKKAIVLVLAALVIPTSVAFAGKPAVPGKSAPKVLYILKGQLSAYSAYNPVGPVMGSIKIHVKSANYHGRALKNMDLTFVVDAKTKVLMHGSIKDGDKGIVKIRAAKRIPAADLAATLQAAPARQVIDQVSN